MGVYTEATAPTAPGVTDADIGKFVTRDAATGLLAVDTVPGSAPDGVLQRVFTIGAQQYGIYGLEGSIPVLTGGDVLFVDAQIQHDSAGLAVLALPGEIALGKVTEVLSVSETIIDVFLRTAALGNGSAFGLNEVVVGTGTAAKSSPLFTFDPTADLLTLEDLAAAAILQIDGALAARTVRISDSAGNTQLVIDTKLANRLTSLTDETGVPILDVNGVAAVRTIVVYDPAGVPIAVLDTVAGTLTSKAGAWVLDLATGNISTPSTSPAAMAVVENDYLLATTPFVRLTPNAANTSLTGINSDKDGVRKVLVNIDVPTLTIEHQDVGSAANNRIITKTGAPVVLAQDGTMDLVYDLVTARWREV